MSWIYDEELGCEYCDHNCDTYVDDNDLIRCDDCDKVLGSVASSVPDGEY